MKRKKTRQKYQAREFDGSDTKGANLADPRGSAFGWKSPFSLSSLSPHPRELAFEVNANISRTLDREASAAKHAAGTGCRCFAVSATRARARARARGRKGKKRSPGERETDRQREETYECGVPYNARGELPLRSFDPWLPAAGWRGQNWSKIACERASREITRSVRRF